MDLYAEHINAEEKRKIKARRKIKLQQFHRFVDEPYTN